MNKLNPDHYLLFSDLKRIFRRHKKRIFLSALIFALFTFFWFIRMLPTYEIKATYKDGGVSQGNVPGGIAGQLFRGFGMGGKEGSTQGLMKSRSLLKEVVETLGLQAIVANKNDRDSLKARVFDNISIWLSLGIQDTDPFVFEKVQYRGDKPLDCRLKFVSKERFVINDKYSGSVGERVSFHGAFLTIVSSPKSLQINKVYLLTLYPVRPFVDHLSSAIKIDSLKEDPSLLELSYFHRNQESGCRVLNALMQSYDMYLKRENERVAKEQLQFLGNRKQAILEEATLAFSSYVDYLKENIESDGFIDFEQNECSLRKSKLKIGEALFNIDFELGKFGGENIDVAIHNSPFAEEFGLVKQEFLRLKKEQSSIDAALLVEKTPWVQKAPSTIACRMQSSSQNLATKVKEQKEQILLQIQNIESQDRAPYLAYQLKMLSIGEKIAKEHVIHQRIIPEEFQGIDLATARKLFYEYCQTLEQLEVKIDELSYLQSSMHQKGFELSAFSTALFDPMSVEIIKEASDLTYQIRDFANMSEKERFRLQEALGRKKQDLSSHLTHCLALKKRHAELTLKKKNTSRIVISQLLGQEIAVLNSQMEECFEKHKAHLLKEKSYYEKEQERVFAQLEEMPDKWLFEKEFETNAELNRNMIRGIAELTESKNIDYNLSQLTSGPVDIAYSSLAPSQKKTPLFACIMGCFGLFATFGYFLAKELSLGIPVSPESLLFRGRSVILDFHSLNEKARLDDLTNHNLEGLRKITSKLLKRSKIAVGLLHGEGVNYAMPLAELLSMHGKKTLVISMHFDAIFSKSKTPGLLDHLDAKDEFPIQKGEICDQVFLGKAMRYGVELLQQKNFREFIQQRKEVYDYVLFSSNAKLTSLEAKTYLDFVEVLSLTVSGESLEDLADYFSWDDARDGAALHLLCLG
ncbi:MAG: hypothetical protein KAR79_05205 [Simkaniaceae bacterium]|nr:hypothetical protein [Simkaniaceae bacterium]